MRGNGCFEFPLRSAHERDGDFAVTPMPYAWPRQAQRVPTRVLLLIEAAPSWLDQRYHSMVFIPPEEPDVILY